MSWRRFLQLFGILLCGVAMYRLVTIPYFYYHSATVGKKLLTQVAKTISYASPNHLKHPPVLQAGDLLGALQIPALSLTAPIVQGTASTQLDVAIGHLPTSVLPGEFGTSVLAAHNATWFRHVNRLHPGDTMTIQTEYGTFTFQVVHSSIVHVGDKIINSTHASIVLESCYPLNALYLTPYRYLVYADLKEDDSHTSSIKTQLAKSTDSTNWTVQIPAQIRQAGVTLATNALPMGTLTYTGHPSNAFVQSNAPLYAVSDMVELYLGLVHAWSSKNMLAAQQMFPYSVQGVNPFLGTSMDHLHYLSGFDVTLDVQGNRLLGVTARTQVQTSLDYQVVCAARVVGNQIQLTAVHIVQ